MRWWYATLWMEVTYLVLCETTNKAKIYLLWRERKSSNTFQKGKLPLRVFTLTRIHRIPFRKDVPDPLKKCSKRRSVYLPFYPTFNLHVSKKTRKNGNCVPSLSKLNSRSTKYFYYYGNVIFHCKTLCSIERAIKMQYWIKHGGFPQFPL